MGSCLQCQYEPKTTYGWDKYGLMRSRLEISRHWLPQAQRLGTNHESCHNNYIRKGMPLWFTHLSFAYQPLHSLSPHCFTLCYINSTIHLSHTHPFMVLALRIHSGFVERCAKMAP